MINCNLTRLSRLLRILRFHAHDLNLKPSPTIYNRYGKGPKQRLRFSKTGDAGLDGLYDPFRMAGQAAVPFAASRAGGADRRLIAIDCIREVARPLAKGK